MTLRVTDRKGEALSSVALTLTVVESAAPQPSWMRFRGPIGSARAIFADGTITPIVREAGSQRIAAR